MEDVRFILLQNVAVFVYGPVIGGSIGTMLCSDKLTRQGSKTMDQLAFFRNYDRHRKTIIVQTTEKVAQKSSRSADVRIGDHMHQVKFFHMVCAIPPSGASLPAFVLCRSLLPGMQLFMRNVRDVS